MCLVKSVTRLIRSDIFLEVPRREGVEGTSFVWDSNAEMAVTNWLS